MPKAMPRVCLRKGSLSEALRVKHPYFRHAVETRLVFVGDWIPQKDFAMRHPKLAGFIIGVVCGFAASIATGGDLITTLESELIDLNDNPVTVAPVQPPTGSSAITTDSPAHYDPLPRRLLEMDRYERMAMEPYPNYDRMPRHEQAEIYARQFEYMRNRQPNFSPEVLAEIRYSAARQPSSEGNRRPSVETARRPEYNPSHTPSAAGPGSSIYDTMKYMYKPAPPKKPKQKDVDINAIPGPWGSGVKAPEPVPEDTVYPEYSVNPDGSIRFEKRMETMREGWNARSIVEGVR